MPRLPNPSLSPPPPPPHLLGSQGEESRRRSSSCCVGRGCQGGKLRVLTRHFPGDCHTGTAGRPPSAHPGLRASPRGSLSKQAEGGHCDPTPTPPRLQERCAPGTVLNSQPHWAPSSRPVLTQGLCNVANGTQLESNSGHASIHDSLQTGEDKGPGCPPLGFRVPCISSHIALMCVTTP